jgi:putative ABC transport system ATP-binding protein
VNDVLRTENLDKSFGPVKAVQDVSLAVAAGEFVAIMGRSGSGKTTLLQLLAGLESPTSGRILSDGQDIGHLDEDGLALWRREHVGLVFQAFHLIPTLSAVENVAFPLYPTPMQSEERRRRALARLEQVGLAHRAGHRPGQLSGGEQQRVAIARALVNHPSLILADEPTGNLDSKSSAEVMELFRKLNREEGVAVVVVTHDPDVAAITDRLIEMKDGRVIEHDSQAQGMPAHVMEEAR